MHILYFIDLLPLGRILLSIVEFLLRLNIKQADLILRHGLSRAGDFAFRSRRLSVWRCCILMQPEVEIHSYRIGSQVGT